MTTQTATKPIDRILELFPDAKGPNTNEFYQAHCPAHNDKQRSLSFKAMEDEKGEGVSFTCFAGCHRTAILAALNIPEEELHVKTANGKYTRSTPAAPPLTLIDLCIDKLIRPDFLMSQLEVMEGDAPLTTKDGKPYRKKGVVIPYKYEDGTPFERTRLRTHISAKMGSCWGDESQASPIPYGLDRLDQAREARKLILVEGESDCWTLWYHGFPALGLPGAAMADKLQIDYLRNIDAIYIIQEPDGAGQKFPSEIKKRLDKISYKGKIYAVSLWNEYQAKDPNDLHKRDIKAFRASFETAMLRAKPLHKERPKPKIYSIADLQDRTLPETRWAIPDILPEGLTLLVGKPKLGKSWLLLAMLQAIASGGVALGNMPVEQGKVLYISLEDNEKRLQKRINTLTRSTRAAKDFLYTTDWQRLDEGGLEDIEQIIIDNPQLRLIGIDTWAKLKPRNRGYQKQQYDEDYEALGPLQKLAGKYGVSIILVHHFRKMAGEDLIDQISGSTAMAGAVDNFLLLDRQRGETDAHLHVFGRDIEEEQDLLLAFDQEIATWKLKGHADDPAIAGTPQQQAILDVLAQYKQGLPLKELVKLLDGKNEHTTRNLLQKLRDKNKVMLKDNRFSIVNVVMSSNDSKRSNHSNSGESEPIEGNSNHEFTMPYYGVTTAVTTPVVTHETPVNTPVEPIGNGYTPQVTTVTTLPIETPLLLPEQVERYPQDVRTWHQAQGLKIEYKPCLRRHDNAPHLPWFNANTGLWEEVCCQCHPALKMSKGKYCDLHSVEAQS